MVLWDVICVFTLYKEIFCKGLWKEAKSGRKKEAVNRAGVKLAPVGGWDILCKENFSYKKARQYLCVYTMNYSLVYIMININRRADAKRQSDISTSPGTHWKKVR